MEKEDLDAIAMAILLASISSGRQSLFSLADNPVRAKLEAGYAFIVAEEFIKVSKNVGANHG